MTSVPTVLFFTGSAGNHPHRQPPTPRPIGPLTQRMIQQVIQWGNTAGGFIGGSVY
jgi:hypothetical protein